MKKVLPKPCPFCGENAEISRIPTERPLYEISCGNPNCLLYGSAGPRLFFSPDAAAEAWNRRVDTSLTNSKGNPSQIDKQAAEQAAPVARNAETMSQLDNPAPGNAAARGCQAAPNLELVANELANAKQKHPHFIDTFCHFSEEAARKALEAERSFLEMVKLDGVATLRDILKCEVLEAEEAHARRDFHAALRELAQCAAVCIRGMEYVRMEIEGTAKSGGAK